MHQVLVCNPPGNALLNEGNKSDEIDARMLADFVAHGHAMNNKDSRQLLKGEQILATSVGVGCHLVADAVFEFNLLQL